MAAYDPNQNDSLLTAARKILIFLNASAGSNVTPTFFSDGHTPRESDTLWITMEKILGALIDGGGGGGGSVNPIYTGSAPPAAPDFPNQGAWFYPNPATGGPNQSWSVPDQSWF